jgi:chemotaxis protein histidine kinase CheA
MVNLRSFKEFSHEMESRLLRNAAQIEADPHNRMKSEMALFNFEWEELRKYMELFKVSEGEGKKSATEITEQKPDDLSLLSKRQELMKLIEGLQNEDAWHSSHLLASLRNEVFAIGRVPLTTMEDKLKMFVNTTRKKLNKNLEIQFKWNDSVIELEKRTSLLEILYHLMNNAVDHGIESPAEREKAGKPGAATIKVEAHAEQGQVEIVVTDDGAGIRRDKLMEKAVESGMCKNLDEAEKMETIQFLTASGVSTAEDLTDISGRGIGLDAVDGKIKKLGGDGLLLESTTVGVGTTFRFVINA